MDPKFLDSPVQGVSDLQASYDHALTGLVKAGTDLDRVGTELNHAQIAFHNAIDDYFKHLQLQIDNKDKAIRLMLEQKIETSGVMFLMQKQLAKLQDEKTTLKAKNKYLTRLLNANPPGENFPGNETFEAQDPKFGPPPNGTGHSAPTHHTTLDRRFASSSKGDYGNDASEIVPYGAAVRDQEGQRRCDEAAETWKKSTMQTGPGEAAAYLSLQDVRERQAAVGERHGYSPEEINAFIPYIRQAEERLNRNPALYTAIYASPEATRASAKDTNCSNVLAHRLQSNGMDLSHQGFLGKDSFKHESQPQVFQQQDLQKANYQRQRAGEVNAGPWSNYNQESTTEAKESFRRQQAAHGWTATTDDSRFKGSTANETTKAIQPVGREPELKADFESSPRKDHSVSVLNPRSPSFVPSDDRRGAAMTARQTPPHKRLSKPDNFNTDLNTASTSANLTAVNSELRNETSIPPHKRFPFTFTAQKTPTLVEADTDLIALEDEVDPFTAIRQYTFKATTPKDHALATLDPNTPKPLLKIPRDYNGVTNKAPASSSLDELKELQTEAIPFSPSYNAPMDLGKSIKKPSQVWLEHMYNQAHDSSEPPANRSNRSTSPPAVDSALGAVHGLPSIEKAKGVPVQQKSTLVLASSPVKSDTNKSAHNTANAATETTVIKTSANSKFDIPLNNNPSTMAEHKIDTGAESEAAPPIVSKAPTPTPPQHFNLLKDNKSMSAAFMAAAQSNLSTFATKYGRDPESDTRKELAAKGRALKEKLANVASNSDAGASLRVPEEQYRFPDKYERARPPIVGTHDLGSLLTPDTKQFVIKPNSRGEWFEYDLDWKPVVKNDGRICYILR